MSLNRIWVFLVVFLLSLESFGQITLDDLITLQNLKSSVKIDSVLIEKEGWDCACYRAYDNPELIDL